MEQDIRTLQSKLLEILKDFDSFCKENDIEYTLAYGTVIGAVRHGGFIPWDDDIDVEMTPENYYKFLSTFENNEEYTLQKDTVDYPLPFSKLRANKTTFIEDIPYRKKYKKINQGMYIDILCMDKVPNNNFLQKLQYSFAMITKSQSLFLRGYNAKTFKKKIIIFFSCILLPFRKLMLKFVKRFNNNKNIHTYTDFVVSRKLYFDENVFFPVKMMKFCDTNFPVPNQYDKYLRDIYGDYNILPSEEERLARIHAKLFYVDKPYKDYI